MARRNAISGKVMTVTGPVEPQALGITNPHEHIFIDFLASRRGLEESHKAAAMKPPGFVDEWTAPLSLANYYHARRNPFLLEDTLRLASFADAVAALSVYKSLGGGCIVDVTPIGLGRNPAALRRLALELDLPIVMGTGFYVAEYHPADLADASEEALGDRMLSEICQGTDAPDLRPGIIGEIGLSWPVREPERKVLRAAARVQRRTGYCLTIHPGRDPRAPMDAIRTIESAGGDPTRTIVDHLDRTLFDIADFVELARTGCYLEQDLFGWETAYYPLAGIAMPNDAIRLAAVMALIDKGFGAQLLVSMDVDTKTRLSQYGGEGYHHIIANVVPMMRAGGLDQAEIDRLIRSNPQRALAIA